MVTMNDEQSDAEPVCQTCGSHSPHMHPSIQADGGEVELCADSFHLRDTPQNTREYIDAVKQKRNALAQPDTEPQRVTDEMVMAACDVLFERTSIAFGGTYMREALEAALNPKQVALYTAPPRPDASAGLIEAANDIEKKANREHHFATSVAKNARAGLIHRHRAEAFEEAVRVLRARAADRSAK